MVWYGGNRRAQHLVGRRCRPGAVTGAASVSGSPNRRPARLRTACCGAASLGWRHRDRAAAHGPHCGGDGRRRPFPRAPPRRHSRLPVGGVDRTHGGPPASAGSAGRRGRGEGGGPAAEGGAPAAAATLPPRSSAPPRPLAGRRRRPDPRRPADQRRLCQAARPWGGGGRRGAFSCQCACLLLRSIAYQGELQWPKKISTDVHKNVSRKIADAAALIARDARSLMFVQKCV